MDYRIFFTKRALNDLAGIIGRIAEDDERAASKFGTGLLDHIDLLARFPRMGSVVAEQKCMRKLVHSPILVYYRFHEGRRLIEIVHLRHGAEEAEILTG